MQHKSGPYDLRTITDPNVCHYLLSLSPVVVIFGWKKIKKNNSSILDVDQCASNSVVLNYPVYVVN